MSDFSLGVVLSLMAGILNGSFASPTKYVKQWKWENIWPIWALVAWVLVPWIAAYATVPNPLGFYHDVAFRDLLLLCGFGVGFGLSQIFFGLGLAAVGLALGFAVMIGLNTVVGSLVPLLILQPKTLLTQKGLVVIAGIAVILIGIIFCAVAGGKKEKESRAAAATQAGDPTKRTSFKMGLVICFFGGVFSPLVNFGLAFGTPLLKHAAEWGVSPTNRPNVLWPPLTMAAFVPYLAYCVHLWRKNRTFHLFAQPGTGINWLLGAAMGSLWMTSVIIYGAATSRMGGMGPVLGWALFMSVIIIASNVWGFMTGEWKGAGRRALTLMLVGISVLILGFGTLAFAAGMG
jgi:L-rhamnose-H+ transport protein